MKITKSALKKLIKEELDNVLNDDRSPAVQFAMAITDKLKALGWSISHATKLYNGSSAGTMSAEQIADLADTILRSEGEEAVQLQMGLLSYPPPGV
jgi:hypothetical protein